MAKTCDGSAVIGSCNEEKSAREVKALETVNRWPAINV
jgi:hypothetical protein